MLKIWKFFSNERSIIRHEKKCSDMIKFNYNTLAAFVGPRMPGQLEYDELMTELKNI